MQTYTLKNLNQFSDIEEQMIILWNKKFKLFRDEKIDKNSLFNQEELKKLILVSFLINTNKKYTVEKLSIKSIDELQIISEFEIQSYLQRNNDLQPLIKLMVVSCFTYDAKSFDTILTICFKILGIEKCCISILFPFISKLSEILDLHYIQESIKSFSKNLVRKHLFHHIKSIPYSEPNDRKWLLFLPENEANDIELLYAYLILKLYNERGIFLGSNQSIDTINECLNNLQISHIITFVSKDYDFNSLANYLVMIKKVVPTSTIFLATYEKPKSLVTEEVPYINVNTPEMFINYLDKIITM